MPYESNPRTKADLVDRLLSQAFTGDLRDIAKDPKQVKVDRIKPHVVSLKIADNEFLLAIHKPKPPEAKAKYRLAYQRRMHKGKPPPKKPAASPKGRYA
jgi:hypothetical protein